MTGPVVVTGAGGFVGARLVQVLRARGLEVRPVERRTHGPLETIDWPRVLAGATAVIHLAALAHRTRGDVTLDAYRAVNVDAAARLARAAAEARVGRFVHVSTAGVLGRRSPPRRPFDDDDPPSPDSDYVQSKLEGERATSRAFTHDPDRLVVVRPTLAYGPHPKANILRLVQAIERGVPLPFAGIDNERSLVGLENLCAFLVLCLEHPRAGGGTFLVADRERLSTPEIARRIGRAVGRPARLFHVPEPLVRVAARAIGRERMIDQLWGTCAISPRLARERLGFVQPSSLDEELDRLAAARHL